MVNILIKNSSLFISKLIFEQSGVNDNTIKVLFKRKKSFQFSEGSNIFIKYDSIPTPTRIKLPSKNALLAEYHLNQHETKINTHLENIKEAHLKGYIQHIENLKEKFTTIPRSKVNTASQLFAVWKYIIENGGRDTRALYSAFNEVYPGKYKNYNCFANAKAAALKKGAEFMAIDQRWFTTPENIKRINVVNQYWATGIISIGKKYSNRNVWEKLCIICKEANEKPPSKGWVDKFRKRILKENINIYKSRYGKDDGNAKQLSFASMKHALYANDQWQMDGWTLPFYVELPEKEGNFRYYNRFTIVIIRDAHSKKIVGSAVGESENTLIIMSALKDAIINTGYLPYEILTDNHSFNKTKEAAYFKDEIAKIGTTFTVTHSPTHKSIIERYNRHLDSLCRDYYGYVGEGIKSKNKDARPSQELLDKYAKKQLSKEEINLIGIKIVDDFNNLLLPKYKGNPNQLYDASTKQNCFAINVFDRAKILLSKTESKVSRGQITIKRGVETYEYQLPSDLFSQCNNTTVIVRYEDLNESVYIYNIDTDEAIIELKQKQKIHGAKANQTAEDIELLNKNKGRMKGIESKSRNKNEQLTKNALEANPEAVHLLNKTTTPKSIVQEFEQKAHLKKLATDRGINLNHVHVQNHENEMDNESLKTVTKTNDSPFAVKNHVIKRISTKYFDEED